MKVSQFVWLTVALSVLTALNMYCSVAPMFQIYVIRHDLHMSIMALEWMVLLTFIIPAILLMISGQLSDKYGGTRIFIIGSLFFLLGSLVVGLAYASWMLLLGEGFMGVAMGLTVPSSLKMIKSNAPTEILESQAMIVWITSETLLGILAIVLGVVFAKYASWRLTYIISILIVFFTLFVLYSLRKSLVKKVVDRHIDYLGTVILIPSLILLLYGISDIQNVGWSALVITFMAVGLGLLVLFFVVESFVKDALFKFKMYKKPEIMGGIILLALMTIPFNIFPYFYNLFVQNNATLHYMITTAGYTYLPFPVTLVVVGFLCVLIHKRRGFLWFTLFGGVLTVVAYLLLWLASNVGYELFWWKLVIAGAGLGFITALPFPYVMSFIKAVNSGEAGGFFMTVIDLFGTLGLAIGHNIYFSGIYSHIKAYLSAHHYPVTLASRLITRSHDPFDIFAKLVHSNFHPPKPVFNAMRLSVESGFARVNIFQAAVALALVVVSMALLLKHFMTKQKADA